MTFLDLPHIKPKRIEYFFVIVFMNEKLVLLVLFCILLHIVLNIFPLNPNYTFREFSLGKIGRFNRFRLIVKVRVYVNKLLRPLKRMSFKNARTDIASKSGKIETNGISPGPINCGSGYFVNIFFYICCKTIKYLYTK